MSVSWLPATDDTTAGAAIKYQVHASTDPAFIPVAGATSTLKFQGQGVTAASITSGLVAGRQYTVRLLAIDQNDAATSSDGLQATISDTVASTVAGVSAITLAPAQVASVTTNTVVLTTGTTPPVVGQFISSADANAGHGYLRKVTAVNSQNGVPTLVTAPASINEVISDIKISSSFKMDSVPAEVVTRSVQGGLAVVGTSPGGPSQQTFTWPQSGLLYSTSVRAVTKPNLTPQQVGLVVTSGFIASNDSTVAGKWGKVTGENRIEVKEGATGESKLRLFITSNDKPWSSSTAVGICKVSSGAITTTGSGQPANLAISLGAFTAIETVDTNRIKVADQVIQFKPSTGAASDASYKIKMTAYLDDAGDACNGDGAGLWRESIDFELEVFVTTENFPDNETAEKIFQGSAGFSVKNNIVTTFSPKVVFDKTLSGSKLTYAKLSLQASPRVEQTLTIDANALGTMDSIQDVISPRKFFKTYVTPAGIPIVVSGEFTLKVRIQGSVTGALTATEKLSIGYDEISAGLEYKDGVFTPIKSATPIYKLKIGGNGKAEADLMVSLLPGLELTGYEVLTGKAVLEPYLTASAGIEGLVRLDAEVDFDAQQLNMAADADYRLTKTRLTGGLNAWLYADFHLWDVNLYVYPQGAIKTKYDTFHKVELIPNTTIMDVPALSAFVPTGTANGTAHPADSRAIKVRAVATNLPNPLRTLFPSLTDSFIKWVRWTAPRIIAPLGTPADSYKLLADPNGEEGVAWVVLTKPGTYTVRMGGYSEWGTWARQYTELQIDVADANANGIPDWWEQRYGLTGTGSAIANADPDGDGKTNLQEWLAGTNPLVSNGPPPTNVPTQTVIITTAVDDFGPQIGPVAHNGTTDDTTPTLNGTLSAPLASGQKVNIYDGTVMFTPTAIVTPGGTSWTFTPATPLATGAHSFSAEVADFQGVPGPRSAAYVVNVQPVIVVPVASVSAVSPTQIVRTLAGSFDVAGKNLRASGISVTVPGDAKATCQTPNNLTTSGFNIACEFYKLGAQTLEVRTATTLLGTVTVSVKTNVTGVTWTSPSTTSSGTVKFGETVVFSVAGVNLLADPTMGFAVQLCGVSNTEVGTPSNTLRSFSCNFNNTAGAVAGQMPGVVKDAPNGQVLLDGWNVAVEVPVAPPTPTATGRLPDTGITASQCYSAGSDVLASCTSFAAIALNNQQDGMVGRDVANNDSTDGKAGFSYSVVPDPSGIAGLNFAKTSCVKDNITGLMWEGKPADGGYRDYRKTFTNYGDGRVGDASAYVAAVNAAGLCGASDWRLPTADELQSIVDYGVALPGPTTDTTWFPNTVGNWFWSSSPFVGGADYAWYVNFYNGYVYHYHRAYPGYVRLVRAGQ
jgi:hypothetical protein